MARVVWGEPITFAVHREIPDRTYSPKTRLLFWGLMASAAAAAVFLLVHGWG
jgi:hypothetical protein